MTEADDAKPMQPQDQTQTPALKLLLNLVLAIALTGFGGYLLFVDTFTLNRMTFSGAPLRLLSVCMLSLAGFAFAILRARLQGTLRAPPSLQDTYMDLVHYKTAVIERFWPFIAVALIALVLAFVLN